MLCSFALPACSPGIEASLVVARWMDGKCQNADDGGRDERSARPLPRLVPACLFRLNCPVPSFMSWKKRILELQSISVIRPPGYRAKSVIGPIVVRYGSSQSKIGLDIGPKIGYRAHDFACNI